MNNLKMSFFMTFMSLVLCFLMLSVSTYAWFEQNVMGGQNYIVYSGSTTGREVYQNFHISDYGTNQTMQKTVNIKGKEFVFEIDKSLISGNVLKVTVTNLSTIYPHSYMISFPDSDVYYGIKFENLNNQSSETPKLFVKDAESYYYILENGDKSTEMPIVGDTTIMSGYMQINLENLNG